MIINYDSPGQLCNRIWSLIPSIAYGLEFGEKVMIINFDEYIGDFNNLNSNRLIRFSSHKRVQRILKSLKARGYIQNGKSNLFKKLFNLNFVEGWSNRLGNAEMVENHSQAIRSLFTINHNIVNTVDSIFDSTEDFTVVGVHIRRGDYKEWLAGIYYYTDDEYIRILKKIAKEFDSKDKKVKFLLSSNEELNFEQYKDIDYFTIPNASGLHDLYALSKCDYIIGPPSSYSQWASFWGRTPVGYIMSPNDHLELSDFSIIVSFNKFENGKVLNID